MKKLTVKEKIELLKVADLLISELYRVEEDTKEEIENLSMTFDENGEHVPKVFKPLGQYDYDRDRLEERNAKLVAVSVLRDYLNDLAN